MMMRTFAGLMAGLLVLAAGPAARAWCLENTGSASVHVQALDARFQADVAAGDSVCCAAGEPCRAADGNTDLLIVTGYEPVDEAGGEPGWTAECRVSLPNGGRVEVSGKGAAIACSMTSG